jgi:hypothetical protein
MKPLQLNLYTGKHPSQNIIDRCNSKKEEEKPYERLSINEELKNIHNG